MVHSINTSFYCLAKSVSVFENKVLKIGKFYFFILACRYACDIFLNVLLELCLCRFCYCYTFRALLETVSPYNGMSLRRRHGLYRWQRSIYLINIPKNENENFGKSILLMKSWSERVGAEIDFLTTGYLYWTNSLPVWSCSMFLN